MSRESRTRQIRLVTTDKAGQFSTCRYKINTRVSAFITMLGSPRVYIDGWAEEERRISARGWRTTSRRKNEERRTSTREWRTTYFAVYWPCTGRKSAKICRSSPVRRDTSFFLRAPRYVVLPPRAEIRSSSAQPSIYADNMQLYMHMIFEARISIAPLRQNKTFTCVSIVTCLSALRISRFLTHLCCRLAYLRVAIFKFSMDSFSSNWPCRQTNGPWTSSRGSIRVMKEETKKKKRRAIIYGFYLRAAACSHLYDLQAHAAYTHTHTLEKSRACADCV